MSKTSEGSPLHLNGQVLESLARSRMYRALSLLIGPPKDTVLKESTRSEILRDLTRLEELTQPEIQMSVREVLNELKDLNDPDGSIQQSYERSFLESTRGHLPLYETEYTTPHIFAKTQMMADIAGFYRAFGMRSSSTHGERPDQASTELEFMHLLTLMKANACSKNDREKIEICTTAERKFIQDHLGRWMHELGMTIAETSPRPFHRKVGRLLAAFIADEIQRLEVAPDQVKIRSRDNPDRAQDRECGLGVSGYP